MRQPFVFLVIIHVAIYGGMTAATETITTDQWPQFRGPGGHAVAHNQAVPIRFTEANTQWEVEVPSGSSSPIIWDDKLFLTAATGNRLIVLCYDRATGKEIWRDEIVSRFEEDYQHSDCSPAAATSCCNGQQIISSFGTFGLVAHDLQGKRLWEHRIENRSEAFGSGSSPILVEDDVFFLRDTAQYSALFCLDASTGQINWRALRNSFAASYSTPYLWRHANSSEMIVAGSGALDAYDPETGERLWTVKGLPVFICPSPVAQGDTLIFGAWTTANVGGVERTRAGFAQDIELTDEEASNAGAFIKRFDQDGDGRLVAKELPVSRSRDAFPFLDHDKSGDWDVSELQGFFDSQPAPGRNLMVAVQAGGRGDITETHVLWESTKNLPYVSSPLIYRNRVYCLKKGGLFTSWDLETGSLDRPMRLGTGGEYYATPVAIGDYIMIAAERGEVMFVSIKDDKPEIVTRNQFEHGIAATPAVLDGTIYVRTAKRLHAISN